MNSLNLFKKQDCDWSTCQKLSSITYVPLLPRACRQPFAELSSYELIVCFKHKFMYAVASVEFHTSSWGTALRSVLEPGAKVLRSSRCRCGCTYHTERAWSGRRAKFSRSSNHRPAGAWNRRSSFSIHSSSYTQTKATLKHGCASWLLFSRQQALSLYADCLVCAPRLSPHLPLPNLLPKMIYISNDSQ